MAADAAAGKRRRAAPGGGGAAYHPVCRGEGHRGPDEHADRRNGNHRSASLRSGGVSVVIAWRVRIFSALSSAYVARPSLLSWV